MLVAGCQKLRELCHTAPFRNSLLVFLQQRGTALMAPEPHAIPARQLLTIETAETCGLACLGLTVRKPWPRGNKRTKKRAGMAVFRVSCCLVASPSAASKVGFTTCRPAEVRQHLVGRPGSHLFSHGEGTGHLPTHRVLILQRVRCHTRHQADVLH